MKRVFIYSSRSLFSQGIKSLLDGQTQLDVVGWETDPDEAIRQIQAVQPDTILIVTRGASTCLLPEAQRLLSAGGRTLIVEVSLEDNRVCLFYGEQFTILGVGDLVKAIVEPFSTCEGEDKQQGGLES